MPKFTEQVQGTSFTAPVQAPIEGREDLSSTLGLTAGIVEAGGRKLQRARGRELGEEFQAEVVTTALAPETGEQLVDSDPFSGMPEAQEAEGASRDVGARLQRAKASMTPSQFRIRAETSLKELMAKHPFFSEEIKRGFIQETGIDPTGSTVAEAFATMQRRLEAEDDTDKQMRKFADQWGIIADDIENPRWRVQVANRSAQEQRRNQIMFTKQVGDYNTQIQAEAIVYDADFISVVPSISLQLGVDLRDADATEAYFDNLGPEGMAEVSNAIDSSVAKRKQELYKTYRRYALENPEKFESQMRFLDDEAEILKDRITKGTVGEYLERSNKEAAERDTYELRQRNPQLARNLNILRMIPQGVAPQFKVTVEMSDEVATLLNSPVETNNQFLNMPNESKSYGVSTINQVWKLDPDDHYASDDMFNMFANMSNILPQMTSDPSTATADNQKAAMAMYKTVQNPNIIEWMNSTKISEQSKDIVRRNFIAGQDKYLPQVARSVAEKVAVIPGAELVINDIGQFEVRGNPDQVRSVQNSGELKKLNQAVKGTAHVIFRKADSATYKKQAEILMQAIQPRVEEERVQDQAPLAKKAQEVADLQKRLSELQDTKRKGPNVIKETKDTQKRIESLMDEIREATGGDKVSFSEEEQRELRIAQAMKEFPDLDRETIEGIV